MTLAHAVFGSVLGTFCALSLQGCAGNGQGLDANGRPLGGGDTNVPLSADFASIQANVFTPICTKCHIGGGAPEGLRLDSAHSYNLLMGVPSTEVPSLLRVKAGDPDSSYIIQKLEGHAAVGAQMPFGGPYLSSSTISFIRQWIANGAPPRANAAPAAQSPALAMTLSVPAANETVTAAPQVVLAFNRELDTTQLPSLTAQLERTNANDVLDIVAARVQSATGNASVLLITPAHPLEAGHYQLVLKSTVTPLVFDLTGHALELGATRSPAEAVLTQFDVEVSP